MQSNFLPCSLDCYKRKEKLERLLLMVDKYRKTKIQSYYTAMLEMAKELVEEGKEK